MKKFQFVLMALLLIAGLMLPVAAADARVTYDGNAQEFIFAPGSEYPPTDLFPNFKDVMPGDSIVQQITVKNDADNEVKVKIWLRALGAHADSVEFLSQLKLRVAANIENEYAYMFDAAADQTDGLTEWVCLGTLYSGGEVLLDVTLDVPVTLDNSFSDTVGYLDWEFMIEEFPIEDSDPDIPPTGDASLPWLWAVVMAAAAAGMILLVWAGKRKKRGKEE